MLIAKQKEEEDRVAELARGASPYGNVGKMIMTELLVFGKKTVSSLSRHLELSPESAKGYLSILKKEELISFFTESPRRGPIYYVGLSDKGFQFIEGYLSE